MDQLISNTAQVKTYNAAIIKNALMSVDCGTKNMIANITGLSVATCNTILNELEVLGEIIEVPFDLENSKNAGRPAKAYRYNERFAFVCCMTLLYENAKRSIYYAVIDLLGNIIFQETLEKENMDYEVIKSLLGSVIEKYEKIRTIGIGIPGVVNEKMEIDTCDIEELNGCHLADNLKQEFGREIVMDNDMNLTAYGFYQGEGYAEYNPIVAISFFENVCPGAGIIVGGKILRGNTNFAGEVSFLPIEAEENGQVKLPLAKKENISTIAKTICSIASIINPKAVMLTGKSLNKSMIDEIKFRCTQLIPEKHIPEIYFVENPGFYYVKGLSVLAIQK